MKKNPDRWVKCISTSGYLKATALVATSLTEEARTKHSQSGMPAKALGEALIGALLLASTNRPGDKVTVSVRGSVNSGNLKKAVADADPVGTARGFILTGGKEIDANPDAKLGPWQNGILSVSRLHNQQPYTGTVHCGTGFLAKDLTYYLMQSEQIPSAVGIVVNLDDSKIKTAGGFLIQVMPDATDKEIAVVEKNIEKLDSLSKQIDESQDPTALLATLMGDVGFNIIEERSLSYDCNCSIERVKRAIQILGQATIDDMIQKDKGAKINCDFCGKKYELTEDELRKL